MKSLVKAGIRIVLIWAFLNSLVSLIRYITSMLALEDVYRLTDILITVIGYLFASLLLALLWWKTDFIVRILIGNVGDYEIIINTSNRDLTQVIIRVFGIILVVTSIPNLFSLLAYHIYNTSFYSGVVFDPGIKAIEIRTVVADVINLLIGLWLVLGWKGILKAIDKISSQDNHPNN